MAECKCKPPVGLLLSMEVVTSAHRPGGMCDEHYVELSALVSETIRSFMSARGLSRANLVHAESNVPAAADAVRAMAKSGSGTVH